MSAVKSPSGLPALQCDSCVRIFIPRRIRYGLHSFVRDQAAKRGWRCSRKRNTDTCWECLVKEEQRAAHTAK